MKAPNMATITASLERSLQNCSLNHHGGGQGASSAAGLERSFSSDNVPSENQLQNPDDASLDLNSNISLPYNWEQCLDLKTGEIYYINWRTGMKATEDPRLTPDYSSTAGYYSDEEDDSSSYGSEESSTWSSPSSSTTREPPPHGDESNDNVLVVGGCKICLMYYMVPKQVEDCPKCSGQLLHFDRSENGSV